MDVAAANIKKGDIVELKSLANPPKAIAEIFEAMSVLKTGKAATWAESKKEMANPEHYLASLAQLSA